jgi:CzcA family heavy metal efflux pump
MKFVAWVQSHARSILFSLAILAVSGTLSSFKLPVALFPQISFPRIRVNLDAGERPAERMAIEATYPLEEALRSIPGVVGVRSKTTRGSAEVSVTFGWGQDMTSALLQAESQINRLITTLPTGTTFQVRRMDPTVFPVIAYSLTSDTRSLTELRDVALYQLRPSLTTVAGVAKVDVVGGAIEEYRVVLDPAKLQSFGLSLNDVATSLSATNILTAVGRVEENSKLYLVISNTRFTDIDQIGATILRAGLNGVVRLDQVATIRRDIAPQFTRVTADAHDAVLFQVYQQPSGNTVQIAKEIRAKLVDLEKLMPSGIKVANWYDQSDLITLSAVSVRDAVLIGVALAAFVLLLFLRNWKVTLIAILSVPAVLASAVLVLYLLHMSFNIMTLGGMAAAVGLIIDDTIVMVEHITRRLRGASGDERARIIAATREFTLPLIGSSLATIIIHVPPAFMSGFAGEFFKALSLTMAASLVISLLIAWLAIPVLATRLLGPKDAEREEKVSTPGWMQWSYIWVMQRLLGYPWLIILLVVPLAIGGYFAFGHVESGFMPAMDEGGFIVDYRAKSGTSLAETDRQLRQLEAILRESPEVETYSRRTGFSLGGDISEANEGDFFVRLKPYPRRPLEDVTAEVRAKIERSLPGLEIEIAQLMEDLIGDLTAVPQPIEIKIYSDDQAVLNDLAPKVADMLPKISGVVEPKSGIVLAGDALDIQIDRVKAALEGMDPDAITKVLNDALTGNITTQIQRGPKLVGVRVWIPANVRGTAEQIGNLQIRAPKGQMFPLKRVATLTAIAGQPQITRENLRRMVAVTARLSGRDLGSAVQEIKKVLESSGVIPKNVQFEIGGLYAEQQTAFRDMLLVIIAGIVLVFILLLFLYESFLVPVAMLLNTALAMAAVFIGLYITRTQLNITSLMGMVMIVGNVTEVAIFYYSEFLELPAEGTRRNRLVTAGTNRLRAITMTTIAAILALMPLALGLGQGSAMLRPLAIAIVAGLIVQLPLVLIVFPSLLAMIKRDRSPDAPAAHV